MNKWNYDSERICFCDGTGHYERGYYFADLSGYECGTEPVRGPFETAQEAIDARVKFDKEEAENSQAIDVAMRKTGGKYDEDQLQTLIDEGVTLTINDGRDGKRYAYWLDDSDCWAVSLDESETELTEEQIEELLA